MFHKIFIAPLLLLCLVIAGCSSTSMTNTWKSPDYAGGYINQVLVVCGEGNDASTRSYEDAFTARLGSLGIKATPAYQALPPGQPVNEQTIRATAVSQGFAYVLVTHLKDVKTKTETAPGAVYMPLSTGFYPYGYGGGPFGPNQQVKFTVGYMETKLYRVQDEAMLWAGESKAFDPHASQSFVNDVITTILGSLAEAGFVPPVK